MAKPVVDEGELNGGLPYLAVGSGPPLIACSGLTSEHVNPKGFTRRFMLGAAAPLAEHFTVYLVNRKPGLEEGATMADLAADHATAIEEKFGEPVALMGVSTGGSVALQLTVDRPDLVTRLVVHASACRLGDHGRQVQREVAEHAAAGRWRQSFAAVGGLSAAKGWTGRLMSGIGWLVGPLWAPDDPTDMLRTIEAEDAFDVTDRLGTITAPTLVVGGERDGFYGGPDLFRQTAEGVADGRLELLAGKGHIGSVSDKRGQQAIAAFLVS